MDHAHGYRVNVEWTGNHGTGTDGYRNYGREHVIRIEGKPDISGSSDPMFRGDAARHNPEDMLVAALSTCHMLAYLHVDLPALQADIGRLNDELWRLRMELRALDAEATHLRAALEQERTDAAERHQFIARIQADLEQKNQHIVYLEQLLQKIEAGRVLRVTRSVNRLLGK